MSEEKIAIRGLMRHYWKKGLNPTSTTKIICEFEGDNTVKRSTVSDWFKRFNSGDTSLTDKPRSGRPSVLDEDDLQLAMESHPDASTRELSTLLGSSKDTIHRNLLKLGYKNKAPRIVPHDLTYAQAQRRLNTCKELLKNPTDFRFWKRIVTSDEKWIFFVNPDNRKKWICNNERHTIVKQDRFGKKVMLCVWWNFEGILHFETIPENKSVNAEVYCEQLNRVYDILKKKYPTFVKRKRVLMQQDNAPAHRARLTQQKFLELEGVEVLPHPPYSPDLAPSDYGLFRSMELHLKGQRFGNVEEVVTACQTFFSSKSQEWYYHQIQKLAERWRRVIEVDGIYFEE